MTDPRVTQLAQVLARYSLDLQPGEEFYLRTSPLAEELSLAVYAEALRAGAHGFLEIDLPGAEEVFYKNASDAQLDYLSPIHRLVAERFTARLFIGAPENTRALSGVDPARQKRLQRSRSPLIKTIFERADRGELKWCATFFPTHASAQEADMSLSEYQDFYYAAGMLEQPDPVTAWEQEGERQRELIARLAGRDRVRIQGRDVEIELSIKDRTFIECSGKFNFPDGEIFTAPIEESVDGWVRFNYPAIAAGREVEDIELWFEGGKVVRERASKGEAFLREMLATDDGARYLGEWGIGTNYGIRRFTKNMLFDEKMGGTVHFAVGAGYPESGSRNQSSIHWDMLCDMSDSEITIDGEVFYRDGRFVV